MPPIRHAPSFSILRRLWSLAFYVEKHFKSGVRLNDVPESIKVCKYDDYKRYTWIEVNLGKEKLYIVACYIPHKDSNYYSRFRLDCDDPFTEFCHDILSFEKLGKVLIMGDFNARVRNFQLWRHLKKM